MAAAINRRMITLSIMVATMMQTLGQHHRERGAATHARCAVSLPGPDRLGADGLHRGRRHRNAPYRLDGRPLRPEARVSGLGHRLHRGFGALRPCGSSGADRFCPPAARRVRRGARSDVADGADGDQSPGEAGTRHGGLGHGRDGRTHSRSNPGRLAHRQLQLALGVLHQHPRRSARDLRNLAITFTPFRPRGECGSICSVLRR